MRRSYGTSFAVVLLFALSYWGARAYSINPYWDGTDGNGQLTNIFLHNIQGPAYLENARGDNHLNFARTYHPSLLYEIPRIAGLIINPLVSIPNRGPIECAISMKIISALAQFLFFGILLVLTLTASYSSASIKHGACAAIILISLSPLALMSSDEFQTDTFSGTFLIGGATLLLVLGARLKTGSRPQFLTLFLAGVLLGCGKNEWSVGILIANLLALVSGSIARSEQSTIKIGSLLLGLLWGNFLSFEINAQNYVEGWSLISGMVASHSGIGASHSYHFLETIRLTFPYMLTVYILIGGLLGTALLRKNITAIFLILLLSGSALSCGFLLSSWTLVSRYFFPGFLLLAGAVCVASKDLPSGKITQRWMLLGLVALSLNNLYFDSGLFKKASEIRSWEREHGALVFEPLSPDEAYLLDICYLLPNVDQNFIHAWVGNETIVFHLKSTGKKLKLNGIKEFPPYTTFPTPYTEPASSAP